MAGLEGKWAVTVKSFMGDQNSIHDLRVNNGSVSGVVTDVELGSKVVFTGGTTDGTNFSYEVTIKASVGTVPFKINGALQEDGTMKGISTTPFGEYNFVGVRQN